MKVIEGKVNNTKGLTSRLSAQIVAEANQFKSSITIKVFDEEADLKSIMNVMALVVPSSTPFVINIEGEDEDKAYENFQKFLKDFVIWYIQKYC